MSQLTLALITLSTWLQLLNLLVLHYDQIAECRSLGAAGWRACDHSLTTLAYLTTSLFVAAPLLPFALWHTPAGEARDNGVRMLQLLLCALVLTGAPVALGLAIYGACAPLAVYAAALGLSCAGVYVVMYLPQIWETVEQQSAGMSYGFLGLHILLGIASALQKAEGSGERVVTWAPPLVANFAQAVLVGLNLHFDLRASAAARQGERAALKLEAGDYGAAPPAGAGARGGEKRGHETLFSREWWDRYL